MPENIKRFFIGRPLKNARSHGEKFNITWGLPILASDAISSVAYAGQEMLLVMVPVIGMMSYHNILYLSLAIIGLLFIIMMSYRQTIDCYPNGGGAYIVAKENLGVFAGVTAGAALSMDYILTVAVSVSSGVDQLVSAFEVLRPFTVPICVFLVLMLMIGNLRGISESSKIFGIPTYLFLIAMISLLGTGFYKYFTGQYHESLSIPSDYHMGTQSLSGFALIVLLLRAFSNGCTALTGIEAVSNAVPSFKNPATKNAKTVLLLLAIIILALFGGTSVLANIYHAMPGEGRPAVLVEMAGEIFGHVGLFNNFMFYFITVMLFVILVLAANTAFSGFPMLISVMANDEFVPRQLKMKGDRLSYSNGIVILSVVAALLIVALWANVTRLLGLYAIGVFISFTLSQAGMLKRWFVLKSPGWKHKALINGFGALLTSIVVVIIAITKFTEGAFIVVFLIPAIMALMLKVKRHYFALAKQLRVTPEELENTDIPNDKYRNRVIVPIDSINKSSIRALRYARTISENVVAFCVVLDEENDEKIREMYSKINTDIPLIIKYSPFRKVVEPLIKYIESEEYDYQKGDLITVILPQFALKRWWHKLLHNKTRLYIEKKLLAHKHIVIATMPLQMKDDNVILNSPIYNPSNERPW